VTDHVALNQRFPGFGTVLCSCFNIPVTLPNIWNAALQRRICAAPSHRNTCPCIWRWIRASEEYELLDMDGAKYYLPQPGRVDRGGRRIRAAASRLHTKGIPTLARSESEPRICRNHLFVHSKECGFRHPRCLQRSRRRPLLASRQTIQLQQSYQAVPRDRQRDIPHSLQSATRFD